MIASLENRFIKSVMPSASDQELITIADCIRCSAELVECLDALSMHLCSEQAYIVRLAALHVDQALQTLQDLTPQIVEP